MKTPDKKAIVIPMEIVRDAESMNGLINILGMSQKALYKRIKRIAKGLDLEYKAYGGRYIYIKGSVPVTVVAHLDIAGNLPIGIEEMRGVITQNGNKSVLGADDRAGVYVMLYHLLPLKDRPNLLFTCNEEQGCLGIKALLLEIYQGGNNYMKAELNSPLFYIQLDRRGIQDCVFYNNEPIEFKTWVESFGFSREHGSYSDISEICDDTRICGVNLSVGYFDEHSPFETLLYSVLLNTIDKAVMMINEGVKLGKRWELGAREVKSWGRSKYVYGYGKGSMFRYDKEMGWLREEKAVSELKSCPICNHWFCSCNSEAQFESSHYGQNETCYICGLYLEYEHEEACGLCNDCIEQGY